MKILLTLFVFFLSFSLIAEDISDFEIEGISIGDSLLDFFSEEEIKNNIYHYYNNKTYTPVQIKSKLFTTYDGMNFNYKTNDNNFIIYGISGKIFINNDFKKCENMKKDILRDIKKVLIDKKFNHWEGNLDSDPLGKYSMDGTEFDNGDVMNITCYDYSKDSSRDHLNITFRRKHFNKFLGYAYN